MNKNHSQKPTDEQLDRLIQTVLHSTILTDEEINEIAAAPQLRRQVLNRVADEKARRNKRWFFGWHWQTATAGAFLFLFVIGATIWFSKSPQTESAAVPEEKIISVSQDKFVSPELKSETAQSISASLPTENSPMTAQKHSLVKRDSSKTALKSKSLRAAAPRKTVKTVGSPKTETATEFIALSYLPASESGQIVRVKVPRSMLVSLGVSTNVERSKELVNAEVIVGDDGAARAIRFLND